MGRSTDFEPVISAVTKPKAYSYIRFSSPEQLKGDSLRRQLELSERYAEQHGLEIDTSLTFRDLGLSAFDRSNIERGELGDFLEAVRNGRIKPGSVLLVESLDRLSRASVPKALPIFMELIVAGITIVTLADGMSYSEQSVADNWTQLIISLTIMARAHDESAMKSKRISAAWEAKRRKADREVMTSRVPAWLYVDGGKVLVDEAKAETVREIFRLTKAGYGLNLIERKLNSEQVPPLGRSKRWYKSYIFKILHSRTVIGEFQPMTGKAGLRKPSGDPVPNYYPAIVSEEEFYAAHQAGRDRHCGGGPKGKGLANIFSGLCKCGYCGRAVRFVDKGKKGPPFLVCQSSKAGLGCRHIPWRYSEFENAILSNLAGLDIAAILKDDSAQRAKDALEAEKAKLSGVQKKIRNLALLAEDADDVTALKDRLAELRADQNSLQAKVRELEARSQAPELGRAHFEQFRKLRESLDQAEGNELMELRLRLSHELKRFLTRIEIYPDGNEPWSTGMSFIGIQPSKEGRFIKVTFKTDDERIITGDGLRGAVYTRDLGGINARGDAILYTALEEAYGRSPGPFVSSEHME